LFVKEATKGDLARTTARSSMPYLRWLVPVHRGATCQESFDHWNSMFQRFRRWVIKKGVWEGVFNALVEYPDFEYLIIDPTIGRSGVRAAA
jgi:hypothetical protein